MFAAPYLSVGGSCARSSCSCVADPVFIPEEDTSQCSQMAGQSCTDEEVACHVQGMGRQGGGEQGLTPLPSVAWCS
jgi:hypothetical protein